MIVIEKREVEVVDFNALYRVSVPAVRKCEVILREGMEELKKFKYLGTVLSKPGEMEGE